MIANLEGNTHMKSCSFKPYILAFGTLLTASFNQLPSGNHTPCMLLDTSSGNPSRRMLRIRLDQGIKEHSSTFDIANFGFGLQNNTIKISEIAFWIDRRSRSCDRRRARDLTGKLVPWMTIWEIHYLIELQWQDLVTRLTHLYQIS